jgi:hypothetical protein
MALRAIRAVRYIGAKDPLPYAGQRQAVDESPFHPARQTDRLNCSPP